MKLRRNKWEDSFEGTHQVDMGIVLDKGIFALSLLYSILPIPNFKWKFPYVRTSKTMVHNFYGHDWFVHIMAVQNLVVQ